ncbi:gephyrin-like molybdotransferase Glp [Aurantimonas sp. VKM B-3413]|uniref:molybdopterin molybdotransferase MoeA n=1 Tax=Aurantimonas sp. VKM B-3413 TaxID=2779401 RepID=UPI001E30702E|nr:gephyrin-like molybdotransferase Glp [Aurantimonas sp. VKM B-3413]MCB8838559.1 molybdopterin molybdotransferase MoeA [Aurantimonas sp. VKM B-3413]
MSLLPVEEAFRRIIVSANPLARRERLPLRLAAGRILAEDVRATRTQPGFDASAMDGYAVRAADTAAPFQPLRVIGESAAGRAFGGSIGPGETVRIFTGAPVPEGADAILIQEDAERLSDDTVRPTETVRQGQHIRPAGVDFSEGALLVPAGSRLSPGGLALAASGGHPALPVVARPRVAILSTGDELVLPGEAVGPSQIVASNTFGIAALVEAAGGEVLDCGIAPDDEVQIGEHLDAAVADTADVFVTIGGASVGDHDLVGKVFASRGVALDFWKVAMRPGKPLMAGRLGEMRIVGLPGNPASSMVAATLFLGPLVRRLAGLPDRPLMRSGVLAAAMPANGLRADFVRSRLTVDEDGRHLVEPLPRQDSSLLSIYAAANVLLYRPPHAGPADPGAPCRFVDLD